MLRYFLLTSAVVYFCSAAAYADPAKACVVPGAPVEWQVAYCMYEEETDSYEAPGVAECIRKQPHAYNDDKKLGCEDSIRYKMMICTMLTKEDFYKNTKACFDDKKLIPDNVKNDGVD